MIDCVSYETQHKIIRGVQLLFQAKDVNKSTLKNKNQSVSYGCIFIKT